MPPRLLLKGLLLMLSLAAIGWAVEASGLWHRLDASFIDSEIKNRGAEGLLIFVVLATMAVAVGLPRQIVCFLGGYAFGLGKGLVLAQAGSLFGCLLCFLYARWLGRALVRHRFAERLARLDDFLHDNPVSMTMLIRFLPVGSNLATNLLAGVSSVGIFPFLVGTLIGYLPQTLIFVLLGSGIHVQPLWRSLVSVVLFLISAAMGTYLYRRLRHGHSLGDDVDEDLLEE